MQEVTEPPVRLAGLGWLGIIAGLLCLLGIYLVTLDQGAVSQAGATLHELMHDGRHLLGFPCH